MLTMSLPSRVSSLAPPPPFSFARMAVVLPSVLRQPCSPVLTRSTLRSVGGAKLCTDAAYMQMSTDRITTFEAQNALLCPHNGNALRPKACASVLPAGSSSVGGQASRQAAGVIGTNQRQKIRRSRARSTNAAPRCVWAKAPPDSRSP